MDSLNKYLPNAIVSQAQVRALRTPQWTRQSIPLPASLFHGGMHVKQVITTFIAYLACARILGAHYMSSLIPTTVSDSQYHSHFTDEETDAQMATE